MAITLPTPLRVAAGIVASGIDLVRSLPEEIPALPVTLIGKAMQLSMKVQQEIADLATKGDELLSGVLGGPQENPPWAHFDDEPPTTTAIGAVSPQRDSPGAAVPGGAGSARAGAARAAAARATAASTRAAEGGVKAKQAKESQGKQEKARHDDHRVADASPPEDAASAGESAAEASTTSSGEPAAEDAAPSLPATTEPAASDPDPDARAAKGDTEDHGTEDHGTGSRDTADTADTADSGDTAAQPANGHAPTSAAPVAAEQQDEQHDDEQHDEQHDDEPAALPDYDQMTLAQVRGYLRSLSAAEVQSLLDHEQSGESRAPFLTLLSNRLVTLEHQEP